MMAHWAEIDTNNVVLRVLVGDNNDPAGDEGYSWLIENLGGTWIQTSINNNFRKQYAGVGYQYDEGKDIFISVKPFPSWILDENSDWQAPKPRPTDDKVYRWDENTTSWVEVPAL